MFLNTKCNSIEKKENQFAYDKVRLELKKKSKDEWFIAVKSNTASRVAYALTFIT